MPKPSGLLVASCSIVAASLLGFALAQTGDDLPNVGYARIFPFAAIAKIIVHGRDRAEAIARMRRVLEMTVIQGIKTSVPLDLKIINDPDFQAGRMSTGFMDRFMPKPKDAKLAESA